MSDQDNERPESSDAERQALLAVYYRYDLLTWANIVDLYRAYPGYDGSRLPASWTVSDA